MADQAADNLEQELKELIAGVIGREVAELKTDANFWQDLEVDSIKAIEITVAIERQYKISIRDEQIPTISTVGQAIQAVRDALKRKENA